MAVNTKFSKGADEVVFTREPQQASRKPRPTRRRGFFTADIQSGSQRMTSRTPRRFVLVWNILPPGSTSGNGGTDYAGLENFWEYLQDQDDDTFTYTDEDSGTQTVRFDPRMEELDAPWRGVNRGPISLMLWED